MKLKTYDKIWGTLFAAASIVIIVFFFLSKNFFEWTFARHHNTLSWYIRPLFIIPIALGAFKKSYTMIFASIFCLFTSMFWFPEPAKANENVIEFLKFEKAYLTSGWTTDKVFVVVAVILFFAFLIYTTWNRKWKWLLFVIVISAFLKVIHSVIFSGDSGLSIVKPAILGVVICVLAILFFLRNRKDK